MADWVGRGGGRKAGQPSNGFSGGAGMGGGRSSDQPSLQANSNVELAERSYSLKGSTSIGLSARSYSIKAAVDYGGSSTKYSLKQSKSTAPQRAGSSNKSASGEMSPRVADPEGNFIFTLEIDGIEVAQFKECSGLKSSTQVFEIEEGGMNHRVHKLPAQSRWDNITLRYGVTSDTTLLKWRSEVIQDEFSLRRNGSVVMKTLQLEEVRRYNFVQAWPVAWEGPSFDANAADLAVEMVEIAHHGISIT
ncbi:MAG: phage tail protein [Pseudomonadota bacterium]|nr:phage tail protein [Pseudomonadota bacterium]